MEGNINQGKILTGKIESLRPVDETLTKKGYAADAKVVGDSLRAGDLMDDELRRLIQNIDPHNADKVNYNNETSGLLSLNVQSAIDEIIANKPSKTYKGDGTTSGRSVDIGGKGQVLCIYGSGGIVFITPYGGFAINNAGTSSFIPVAEAYFANGVLTINTNADMLNKDGSTYPYILL